MNLKNQNFYLKIVSLMFLLLPFGVLHAQEEAENQFNIKLNMLSRGELRYGGFDEIEDTLSDGLAHFILGRYRITADYQREKWLETKLSVQQSGVWGQAASGINLYEGWAMVKSKGGLFAKFGRQELSYDDQRILGPDDWTMAAFTHDMLKLGYESQQHKVHLMLAYNQNPENMNGNTFYIGGNQPYKSMINLWYHYDTPKSLFGGSFLFMNIGMQNANQLAPKVFYQQLLSTYLTLKPKNWLLEGSFYYQMGREEHGIPIDAFMAAIKLTFSPNDKYTLYGGYDYLSGDKYFAVPPEGDIGLVFHDKVRGFNPVYGSQHEFYGAMEFFYLRTYVFGFTPGLQNAYLGSVFSPVKNLGINVSAHGFAMATQLPNLKKGLGIDLEFSANYAFNNFISAEIGYSFMYGTETMKFLKRVSDKQQLQWAYLMVVVNPNLFSTSWRDKK